MPMKNMLQQYFPMIRTKEELTSEIKKEFCSEQRVLQLETGGTKGIY